MANNCAIFVINVSVVKKSGICICIRILVPSHGNPISINFLYKIFLKFLSSLTIFEITGNVKELVKSGERQQMK
jgi:hypothetical protein